MLFAALLPWAFSGGLGLAMTYTAVHRTPLDLVGAEVQGLIRLPFSEGLYRSEGSSATLVSPVIEAPAPFDDLVGSWNATLAEGASLEMQAQVRTEAGPLPVPSGGATPAPETPGAGSWSPWFTLGTSEGGIFRSPPSQENAWGVVDVDTLKLRQSASALRYRFNLRGKVSLRLAATTVTDGSSAASAPPFHEEPIELRIPPRSQMTEQEKYKHDICSPTTLAMALDHWGARLKTIEVARRVEDRATGKFGVWPFNTAMAAEHGLEAYVARLEWEGLQDEITRGRPVAVSVTFGPGELSGAPLKKTKGHLMLVVGFTGAGDVIALDPAAPGARSARRVYGRAQFHRAWRVNKKGLAYVIGRPFEREMIVGVPTADLWASPRLGRDRFDLNHLSQLLYGEAVRVLGARGDWVRVQALEQENFLAAKKWQGYPGWIQASDLRAAALPRSTDTIRVRRAVAKAGSDRLELSLGTRLERLAPDRVRLLDGRVAEIDPEAFSPVSPDPRVAILKTAEMFLDTNYHWGGRSGVQPDPGLGVDCSGLVNLAYRAAGIDIPRNAHDQRLKARPVRRGDLKPGDLAFLTDSPRSTTITHVMLYAGGDAFIESQKAADKTLRSSFNERFGTPLSGVESGDVVMDRTPPKPRRRRVYFGSYLVE